MKTLNELDTLASGLLQKLPELMQAGTVYANDLVHRFIYYIIVTNSIKALSLIILNIFVLFFAYKLNKKITKELEESNDNFGKFMCSSMITFSVFLFILVTSLKIMPYITNIVQVYFVPELFILNYFK